MFVCCKAAEGISDGCQAIFCPQDRPSPIFTLWAFCMNTITIILAAIHVSNDSGLDCTSKARTWTFVMFAICGVHMLFSLYLYIRFTSKIRSGEAAGTAANKLFMYDFGVYFYIWFLVFTVVWLILSSSWTTPEAVCFNLADTASIVICQVIFLVAGGFVIVFSLMTECCSPPRWQQHTVGNHQSPATVAYQPVVAPQQAYAPQQQYPQQQQQQQQQYYSAPPPTNPNYNRGAGTPQQKNTVASAVNGLFSRKV